MRDDTAHAAWAAGQLVPYRITLALDLRKLDGPEVDIACHAAEPDVDHWEAGVLYPRWDQVRALADLTKFPVGWFVTPVGNVISLQGTSLWSHMTKKERTAYAPPRVVRAFRADAIEARLRGSPPPMAPTRQGQLDLF